MGFITDKGNLPAPRPNNRGVEKSKRQTLWDAKVDWLIENIELWDDEVIDYHNNREVWAKLVSEMKAAGLVSKATGPIDVRLRKLISDAKKKIEEQF